MASFLRRLLAQHEVDGALIASLGDDALRY
jgi:hypothetical protein